jgi:hypothetical protein
MSRRISTVLPTSVFLLSAAILFSSSVAYAQSAALKESQSTNLSLFTNLYNNFDHYTQIFTPYRIKKALTGDPGFTNLLHSNAQRYIPWILNQNTQAHLGFWSGPGNRGNLVRLLGDINNAPPPPGSPTCTNGPSSDCAIWDEGAVESEQYPLYVEMLVEHWYEREDAGGQATVSIYGKTYPNKNPLSKGNADQIWGQYSQRYADMAVRLYQKTSKPVKAWCFVGGARSDRIFCRFEYPRLQKLESGGYVIVNCTKNPDADWTNPKDWTVGTTSADTSISS